jgi:hypothetical protein
MKPVGLTAVLLALATVSTLGDRVEAQPASEQQQALRRSIERRFDVLHLRSGVVLQPKAGNRRVRTIEISDDGVALDGTPATGSELRQKLGSDADLILQLSYLAPDVRQRLFGAPDNTLSPPPLPPAEAVSPPAPPEPPPLPEGPRRRIRRGDDGNDRVRFGGNVTVEEGERVDGDVVAIGGAVRVNGIVTGNTVAIGGGLSLGPHSEVEGDAVAIGGGLSREEGARVGGKVVDMPIANFDFGRWRWNPVFGRGFPFVLPFAGAAAGLLALMGTLMRVFVLCVLASIVLLVARDHVERVGARAAAEPLKAGAIGLLAQLLFLPLLIATIVVLVITIIGIPLLVLIPFALLGLAVVGVFGFTAVAYYVGRIVRAQLSWHTDNAYLAAVTGVVLLVSPLLVARLLGLANWLMFPITGSLVFLGLLVEYIAWTVGFGAVALHRFGRSSALPSQPPPAAA